MKQAKHHKLKYSRSVSIAVFKEIPNIARRMTFVSSRQEKRCKVFVLFCSILLLKTFAYVGNSSNNRNNERKRIASTLYSTIPPPPSGPDQFRETQENGNDDSSSVVNGDKTLYEILGAPATATRAELKKCYVELAKVAHPDAQISRNSNNNNNNPEGTSTNNSSVPDFNDIASAWRILGDAKLRKRYDRELRAKAFSEAAERFASENLEKAAPAVASMMDNVAVPFLRRTAATTSAVSQAFSKRSDDERAGGLTDAFKKAVQASQDAGRYVDSIELAEKSQQLEEK